MDRDIVEATAKRMGLSSLKDEIFYTQKNIIRDFAAKGSCIIVGRCADYILADIVKNQWGD